MNNYSENQTIKEEFLQRLCSKIRYKKIHPHISREVEDHIDDISSNLIEEGMDEQQAVYTAIKRMGDPMEIGRELNKTYRPAVHWPIITTTFLLNAFGLFILNYLNNLNYGRLYHPSEMLFSTVIGVIAMIFIYLFDYKRIESLSLWIYSATCITLLFGKYIIYPVDKLQRVLISLMRDPTSIFMPLLILSYAGVVKKLSTGRVKDLTLLIILSVFPIFSYPRMSHSLILSIIFLSMIFCSLKQVEHKNFKKYCIFFLSILSMVSLYSFLNLKDYQLHRINAFLHPTTGLGTMNYQEARVRQILSASKIIGSAQISISDTALSIIEKLPGAHTNHIFSTVIAVFGWAPSIILLIFLGIFIWKLLQASSKITDLYGRILTIGVCASFSLQITFCILINLALLPPSSVNLPFISYGKCGLIGNMVQTGLLLSVYRKKNLIIKEELPFVSH